MKAKSLILLAAAFIAALAVWGAGCKAVEDVVIGHHCSIDEDCPMNFLCDTVHGVCAPIWGEPEFPDEDKDVELPSDSDQCLKSCSLNSECPANYHCNTARSCCVSNAAETDYEPAEQSGKAYLVYNNPINFGAVLMGSPVCKELSISNQGTDVLVIYEIYYDQNQTQEFKIDETTLPQDIIDKKPISIPPLGQLMPISICYQPVDNGIDSAVIEIASNASNGYIQRVTLQSQFKGDRKISVAGDPNYYDAITGMIYFGNVDVGAPPAYTWLHVWNSGDPAGNNVLKIDEISLAGQNGMFSLVTPSISTLHPILLDPKGEVDPCPPPINSLPALCSINKDCRAPGSDTANLSGLTCSEGHCVLSCAKTDGSADEAYCQKGHPKWGCNNNTKVCESNENPRACATVGVYFHPYENGVAGDHIQIFNDSQDQSQQVTTVDLSGESDSYILMANPNPIACHGKCEYGKECTTEVTIYNNSGNTILIHKLYTDVPFTVDTPNASFYVDHAFDNVPYEPITLDPNEFQSVIIHYVPQPKYNSQNKAVKRDDMAYLKVEWCVAGTAGCRACDINTESTVRICERNMRNERPNHDEIGLALFPVMCTGRPENVKPVAVISTQPHGAPVTAPINGLKCGEEKSFFGGGSYDEDSDSNIKSYCWRIRKKPAGSQATLKPYNYYANVKPCPYPHDTDGSIGVEDVTVTFDASGDYEIALDVMDDLGAWTEYEGWVAVNAQCNRDLGILLVYDGCNAKAQVDLDLKSPMGSRCSEKDMNSSATCNFGTYGAGTMVEWATTCASGKREQIITNHAQDGVWTFCAKYIYNCDHLAVDIFNEQFCLWTAKINFTIYLFDPLLGFGNWICSDSGYSGSMKNTGDQVCWTIKRKNGDWECPPSPVGGP